MQGGEQTPPDQPQFTSSDMGALRRKLKGKLKDKDDEIDELRQQLEELKTGRAAPTQSAPSESPPTLESCDFDEGKYQAEMAKWAQGLVRSELATHTAKVERNQSNQQAQQALNSAVDQHYGRAAKLVNDGLVSAEDYQNADALFRGSLEQIKPTRGDQLADTLISRLGDGSEKVVFHLAKNDAARAQLLSKLTSDQTGLEAMVFLGELKQNITTPRKPVSRAPQPGADLKPDDATNTSAKALKRRYDEAQGNVQDRISIKRAAKAAGHDTTKW